MTSNPIPTTAIQRYYPYCHNFLRVKDVAKRELLLYQGSELIVQSLLKLPKTSHKSVEVEVFLLPKQGILSVNIRGTFTEDSGTARLFVRLLLLTPAEANSKAAQAGWQAVVTNDMLHIKN